LFIIITSSSSTSSSSSTNIIIFASLHLSPFATYRDPKPGVVRGTINDQFDVLGLTDFSKAYRMSPTSFMKLWNKIKDKYPAASNAKYIPNKFGIRPIPSKTRLAVALRMFAGASYADVRALFNMSNKQVYRSMWLTVDAVNNTKEFDIGVDFDDAEALDGLARGFASRSSRGVMRGTIGAVDGLLIKVRAGGPKPRSLYCRKGFYALNMQAVCDADRKIIDFLLGFKSQKRVGTYSRLPFSMIRTPCVMMTFISKIIDDAQR
jgi:hypothetical protein